MNGCREIPTTIQGCYVAEPAVHYDDRGSFLEVVRAGTSAGAVLQTSLSRSKRGALRGLHCSPYRKTVVTTHGAIFEVVVDLRRDSPTYLRVACVIMGRSPGSGDPETGDLAPPPPLYSGDAADHRGPIGSVLVVPPGCAHGFAALTSGVEMIYLQEGEWIESLDVNVHYLDPICAVPWPAAPPGGWVLSPRDAAAPRWDPRPTLLVTPRRRRVLLMGASGYLGSHFYSALVASGAEVILSHARIENREAVSRELDALKPDAVVCCAGVRGVPNIDWCETHQEETIRANVLGQLAVVDACAARARKIHVTVISSGALYRGAKPAAAGGGSSGGWTEEDPPTFTESFYSRTRASLETLLASYSNVLTLRVLYPVSADMRPESLLTKLTTFPKVHAQASSISVLEDVIPAAVALGQRELTGVYNLVNPGTISPDEMLTIYRDAVDPSRTWEVMTDAPNRAICELDTAKLAKAGVHLPSAREAILRTCAEVNKRKVAGSLSASGTSTITTITTTITTIPGSQSGASGASATSTSAPTTPTTIARPEAPAPAPVAAPASPPPLAAPPVFQPSSILLTGGAGFIGSHVCDHFVHKYPHCKLVCLDVMDYCASMANLALCADRPNFSFVRGDINDTELVRRVIKEHSVDTVLHFAAQSHVDLSFGMSLEFTRVNVLGTHALLECAKNEASVKRFIFVSTDEVYGEILSEQAAETATLDPTNPYSASKAAAEMITKAYIKSFHLPVIIVRGNNVFGPRQFPEKVIPKFILRLAKDLKCCVHGNGAQKRTYVYVSDVAEAFDVIVHRGRDGEIYNIGTDDSFEVTMLQLARELSKRVKPGQAQPDDLIEFVEDRKFNDCRYSVDTAKLRDLGWSPRVGFDEGLKRTIEWYLKELVPDYWGSAFEFSLQAHPPLPK